jgi:hypothetical protein
LFIGWFKMKLVRSGAGKPVILIGPLRTSAIA